MPPWAAAQLEDAAEGENSWSLKDFTIVDELFRSGTGGVFKAVRKRDKGTTVVLKQKRCRNLYKRREAMNEVTLLTRLKHPNIVECFGSFWDSVRGSLYVVLEYARGGDLHSLIQSRHSLFPEPWIWLGMGQICAGLLHCHQNGVVHRDIKPLNILVCGDDSTTDPKLKLADLGVSRQVGAHTTHLHTMYGTPLYASPEVCEGRPYNEKTDVWSLGVVLYEMAALKPPFLGATIFLLFKAIQKATYDALPDAYSERVKDLLASLLASHPDRRPPMAQIVSDYFTEEPSTTTENPVEDDTEHQELSLDATTRTYDDDSLESRLKKKRSQLKNLKAAAKILGVDENAAPIQKVEAELEQLVQRVRNDASLHDTIKNAETPPPPEKKAPPKKKREDELPYFDLGRNAKMRAVQARELLLQRKQESQRSSQHRISKDASSPRRTTQQHEKAASTPQAVSRETPRVPSSETRPRTSGCGRRPRTAYPSTRPAGHSSSWTMPPPAGKSTGVSRPKSSRATLAQLRTRQAAPERP